MKQTLYIFLLGCLPYLADAQSPFIPLNADYYHLIDRFEIRQGAWATGFHSSTKPYNRQSVIQLTDSVIANPDYITSPTDRFNLNYLRDDSWEWVTPPPPDTSQAASTSAFQFTPQQPGDSRVPLFNIFYQKKADAYSLQTPEFDLHVNPVVYAGFAQQSLSNSVEGDVRPYVNTRGLELRGTIGKKLGFYTFFSDNQAAYPRYLRDYGQLYGIDGIGRGFAPGEGFAKEFKQNGVDYISARGYITINALKIINIQFGHDRNFIGNGFRSLLLSDNAPPYLFLKLTTRLGPFQYMNLFTELQNTQAVTVANQLIPQKFAAFHHLSANFGKHVNVGLFESEIFSRDRVDLNYLNPIIFYRFVESFRGSADNANIGLDFKVNFKKYFLAYGQFMLDEFILKELVNGKGSWTNKFAVQAGVKYIDAFGVPNLDVQAELNLARPYTYSHENGQANYAHYSQPLAHPLGANFIEGIGIAKYQVKQWSATGIFSVMKTGRDTPGHNYGGDILLDYTTRVRDEGNFIGQGRQTLTTFADLRLSYMVKHNIFVDARYLYRLQASQYRPDNYTTNLASLAIRWNIAYRNWVL